MRVLVTGASGYVGGGIVRALLAAGHEVVGLARDETTRLPDGVRPRLGDLTDPASLAAAGGGVDGVIHAGASPEDADGEIDLAAVRSLLDALAGSGRFFVHTSGSWVVGETGDEPASEDAPLDPPRVMAWRPRGERLVRDAAGRGVRSVIVRPGTVYGRGGGYVPMLLAPQDGVVRHFGNGENRWSVVHVDDLGELYRLAAERAPAGSVYHGAAGVVRYRDAAEAAAHAAGARVEPWPPVDAEQAWGGWVEAFSIDHVASGDRARRELGWAPSRPDLIEELRGTTARTAAVESPR
jgi:nucleoside-diphosphate-sugar epimerase